jgi:5-methylcytosine-specific restriction protein B
MNLARVEYYFSDILSILETRHFSNGSIVTDKLIPVEAFGQDNTAAEKYSNLYIPENLYIIGTVNMDETTFPFSKKVLYRANTIEISNIDLDLPEDSLLEVDAYELDNSFLRSEYLQASDCIGLIMFYLHIKLDIRIEKL